MARSPKSYLVTYDVSCPKRWRRVYRLLQGYGDWMQLFVFRCRLDPWRRRRMEQELRELIDVGEDRLLIAKLDEPTQSGRTAGRAQIL